MNEKLSTLLQSIIENGESIVQKSKEYEFKLKEFLISSYSNFPVQNNILSNTKTWDNLCQGKVNTSMNILDSHRKSGLIASNLGNNGTLVNSKLTIITLDKLDEIGASVNTIFQNALGELKNGVNLQSNVNILLLEIILPKGHKKTYFMGKGKVDFTGLHKGDFKTQSRVFVNLIEQSGNASVDIMGNATSPINVNKSDVGKSWIYKTNYQTGWGRSFSPVFKGEGIIKIAIALPYASVGYHGPENFVWQDKDNNIFKQG